MKFIKNLKFLFMPSFWIMLYKHHPEMDYVIENIIENDLAIKMDNYTVKLVNNQEIWIGNYPYGYGIPYDAFIVSKDSLKCRPSRENIRKFKKYLDRTFGVKKDEVEKFAEEMRRMKIEHFH